MISLSFLSCNNQDKLAGKMTASIKKYFNERVTENKGLQIYKFLVKDYTLTNEFAVDSIRLTSLKWEHESLYYSTNDLMDQSAQKMTELNMAKRNRSADTAALQADYDKCYSTYLLTKDSLEKNEREDWAIKAKIHAGKKMDNSYYKVEVSLKAKHANATAGGSDYRADYNYILDKNFKVIGEELTYSN